MYRYACVCAALRGANVQAENFANFGKQKKKTQKRERKRKVKLVAGSKESQCLQWI